MPKVTLSLVIDVVMELNDESQEVAMHRLADIPATLADNGRLTGDGPAEVVSWEAHCACWLNDHIRGDVYSTDDGTKAREQVH